MAEGEEVTLMDWGNCFFRRIHRDASGRVTGIEGELHPSGDPKKTKLKLTWLADNEDKVKLRMIDYDYLITKKKVEEEDDFVALVNRHSRKDTVAWGCGNLRTANKGDIFQLERKGYFILDQVFVREGEETVIIAIPDGKQRDVGIFAPKQ